MPLRGVLRVLFLGWLLVVGLLPAAAQPGGIHVVTEENYPPLVYRDAEGKLVGYIVDVWRLWEARTGIPVRLTAVQWTEAQAMLLRGEADVIDLIYKTPPREALYDSAEPYLRVPVVIYAHQSITGLTDLSILRDFEVSAQAGDACLSQLEGFDEFAMLTVLVEVKIRRIAIQTEQLDVTGRCSLDQRPIVGVKLARSDAELIELTETGIPGLRTHLKVTQYR